MNKFSSVMKSKQDFELLEITTKLKGDYQEEALIAAEEELESRNLNGNDLKLAEELIKVEDNNREKLKGEPLSLIQKILFFLFFYGIIPWAIAGTFKAKGYDRKYKEAWKAMKYGFLSILLIIILIFVLANYR